MSSGSNNPGSNSGNPFQDVFPQSPQPRRAVPVTQFSPMPPDQHIIEAITDEINDIDLSIHHPIYLNDSDPPEDSILVPRPETPHGSLFYSTARNLGVVNTITNNVPIRSFVKRVFKLFDGRSEAQVAQAREQWRSWKASEDLSMRYFAQDDTGRWEQRQ